MRTPRTKHLWLPLLIGAVAGCDSELDGLDNSVFRANCAVHGGLMVAPEPMESDEYSSISLPIVGGQPTAEFPGVGYLRTIAQNGERQLCAGTLVTAQRIVTAAHCFFGGTDRLPIASATFGFGPIADETIAAPISAWQVHPNYQQGSAPYDIAYFDLPTAQTHEQAPLFLDVPCQGQRVLLVGYGLTNPNDPGSLGTKHAVAAIMDRVEATTLHSSQRSGGSCRGDSGGPAMIFDQQRGVYRLVAVTSRGPGTCDGEATYARVSAAGQWLTQGAFSQPLPSACTYICAANGICEDGGPNATAATCAYGTDCADCGPR